MNLPGEDPRLSRIATHREQLAARDAQELQRYYRAVYCYVVSIVRDPDRALELTHQFAERFVQGEFFEKYDPARGKFRVYLKNCVRWMVLEALREEKRRQKFVPLPEDAEELLGAQEAKRADEEFDSGCRDSLLDGAWRALHELETRSGTPYYTALELKRRNPELRSAELARQLRASRGSPLSAENARQILKRARDQFAQLLLDEVLRALPPGEHGRLEEELIELQLLPYVKSALKRRRAGS